MHNASPAPSTTTALESGQPPGNPPSQNPQPPPAMSIPSATTSLPVAPTVSVLPASNPALAPPALPTAAAAAPASSAWAVARRVFRGWVGLKEREDLQDNLKGFISGRVTDNGSKLVRVTQVGKTGEETRRTVRRSIRMEKKHAEEAAKTQKLLGGTS